LALRDDPARIDAFGRAMTLALAQYVRRPVRCSAGIAAQPFPNAWRFTGRSASCAWWLELEADLVGAFADAMIGGDGSHPLRQGRRVRSLGERIAGLMMRSIAEGAGVDAPARMHATKTAESSDFAIAGGRCAVATADYGWRAGAVLAPSKPTAASGDDLHLRVQSPRVLVAPGRNAESIVCESFRALVERMQEKVGAEISTSSLEITTLDGAGQPALPQAALRLALTAGGSGAVVVVLDRGAVRAVAAAAAAAALPRESVPGRVIQSMAEAIVRDAVSEAAAHLPAIASDAHRIVSLADDPLPARAPHHCAQSRIASAGESGAMRLLVPSWMLGLS
ncbi:MAG TPA: hypothetical protein VEJ20_06530, partial [Candidatus Eremiobacteraceae bacterium]|nr:hypothetical protein [Candidatus Eremiobacteraceae bacterium]